MHEKMLRIILFVAFISVTTSQYYPYPFLPYHHHPSHLPAYLPQPSAMPPPPQATYYIVQAPPQQFYRTAESAEAAAPTYSAQPSSTVAISAPPSAPPPSAMSFPGGTYFIASPYPFPSNGAVFQGAPYPFPSGGPFLPGPTLVAPPYEKKQKKTKVTSNRIA